MPLPEVLVLILAGGAGNRLELLTATRAKPAVPFAGRFRLIDFPLSNCQHAQIADVWISVQYNPASLTRHLSNGRPWDLDRTTGGMLTLPPRQGSDRGGWHAGTADSLWRNAELIRDRGAELLVVLSADAVYKLDYREVVEAHLQGDQELTMVTTRVAAEDAGRYGVVQVGDDDRITDYAYKPEEPATSTVATEVFVMTADRVLERLEALAQDAGDEGLDDLGDQLLPDLVDDGLARSWALDGYWRDVGTVQAYWQAHQEFLVETPPLRLDDPQWPVHTRAGSEAAAWLGRGAEVENSLVSGGAWVAGSVAGSVLSPGVVIEAGAQVVDSVLLPGAVVRKGAVVRRAILDDGVVVGPDARVGGGSEGEVALVGRAVELSAGTVVAPGGRLPEED
jgi:glucose-1-phosphate adenylyltransferase